VPPPATTTTARLAAATLADRSARGIAAAVGRLISAGELADGARLPTVRAVAGELGVSPGTVGEAWRLLGDAGLVSTHGRNGTLVNGTERPRRPGRYGRLGARVTGVSWPLASGTPDPSLLPPLDRALARLHHSAAVVDYLAPPVLPELAAVLQDRWPHPVETVCLTSGCLDALDRLVRQLTRFGDKVVVEHPTFPPLLDLVAAAGAEPISVTLDDDGMDPAGLAAALTQRPRLVLLQPRAHNPTGITMTPSRAATLAELVRPHPAIVIEDDHIGDLATTPPVTLGAAIPHQTVRVLGFSKAYGPDLRLAAVGGPAGIVQTLADGMAIGPGWTSRLLQRLLADLLTDAATQTSLAAARRTYTERREQLIAGLAARGVELRCADGINCWLPVADEADALVRLATQGVAVAPGAPFMAEPDSPHVRVTVGRIDHGIDHVVALLADAAAPTPATTAPR
jgi:DNA-binding transcriptional MocR family regulator